jgi:DNA-binding GntR family transcriptional regulator
MKVPLPKVTGGRVLASWVTASLREAILNGYFEAGEKLDQDLIAKELKVSRTPVREALKVLESEGFIELRPHRGAFIPKVSRQDICEIYEFRGLLEAEMVRQVTPIIPDSVLDELEQSLEENLAQLESEDRAGHVESDIYFHETIVKFVENTLLKESLEGLNNRIIRVRRFAQLQPGYHLLESLEEHRAIFQAMRRRDPEAAAEAMLIHLEKSSQRIQQFTQ